MDRLRKLPFFLALGCFVIVFAGALGATWIDALRGTTGVGGDPPGMGVPSLAVIEALLVFTVILMGLPLLVPEGVHGRIQGVATLIVSIIALIVAFFLALADFLLLMIMVSLLLAAPFGTIAYLAIYGTFPTGAASTMLGALMFLKLVGCVLLVIAHQSFLANKGLVLLVLTTLLGYLVIAFLHAIVPMPLVSITDCIGGIVGCILALIWALFMLIFSLPAVFKAIA